VKKYKKVQIEFDSEHLPVLLDALETYSRLQSGQVGMAMDVVYADRWLSWDEREHMEKTVRFIAFPPNLDKKYDGNGGFFDQYENEYDEKGNIVKESDAWKLKKKRPHLDHPNSSFGVGCPEMKQGTIAWEIKKAIQEYLHYERNGGYRDMGVDGDGVLNISGIPNVKILDHIHGYWKPQKAFRIPQRYQDKITKMLDAKEYKGIWEVVEKAFKRNPLPQGSCFRIEQVSGTNYVVVEKPIKKL
jgi:hypothetical protein